MGGIAGYTCFLRKSGTSTAVVDEALSLVTGTTFQITAAAKRVIDPNVSWVLEEDNVAVPVSRLVSIDFVNGVFEVTGVTGTLTFTGNYLPLTTASEELADVTSFTLNESTNLLDKTVMTGTTGMHSAIKRRMVGLRDVELSVDCIAEPADLAALDALMTSGAHMVTEVYFGSDSIPRFRGYCKLESVDRSSSVDGRVETSLGFKIAAVTDPTYGKVASYSYRTHP